MPFKVAVQCRIPDEAFAKKSVSRKDGRSVAPVGATVDRSKVDPRDLERLLKSGAIVEEMKVEAMKGGKR